MKQLYQKLKDSIVDYFYPQRTIRYFIKRVDKFYGLQGFYYKKYLIVMPSGDSFDRLSARLRIDRLLSEGYVEVTKEQYHQVEEY